MLISDHSSVAFEYLLLDRPLVRIEMPELIRRTDIPEDYVALMASASTTVRSAGEVLAAVEHALADPTDQSSVRRQVAADLFYAPGGATRRAVLELYDLVELPAPGLPRGEGARRLSVCCRAHARDRGRGTVTTLDVVIPTFNRAPLLRRTLDSLLAADPPAAMSFAVTVCDNRSTDDTRAVVAEYQPRFAGRLHYVYETVPGRSAALNAGIAATTGDLVAMIDDDEEVDRTWLRCIERAFEDPATDFIGGPYVPRWTVEPPKWLPPGYGSVIGRVDSGSEVRQYGPGFDGMLMGGNAVIRRALLTRVGPYRTDLGRSPTRLLSCEDDDMFQRLLAAGARGFYRPDLIIHHYVAPERVSKSYFRRWCYLARRFAWYP